MSLVVPQRQQLLDSGGAPLTPSQPPPNQFMQVFQAIMEAAETQRKMVLELFCRAFLAETGRKPSDIRMIQRMRPDGIACEFELKDGVDPVPLADSVTGAEIAFRVGKAAAAMEDDPSDSLSYGLDHLSEGLSEAVRDALAVYRLSMHDISEQSTARS